MILHLFGCRSVTPVTRTSLCQNNTYASHMIYHMIINIANIYNVPHSGTCLSSFYLSALAFAAICNAIHHMMHLCWIALQVAALRRTFRTSYNVCLTLYFSVFFTNSFYAQAHCQPVFMKAFRWMSLVFSTVLISLSNQRYPWMTRYMLVGSGYVCF